MKNYICFLEIRTQMNKLYSLLSLVLCLNFFSCVPNKDVVYLQGSKENSIVEQVKQKPYRLQINDIVAIKIKALDPKLVDMFSMSATQSSVGGDLYFDGYTVNDHGVIRIPVLGEISAIGLTLDELRLKIEKQLLSDYFHKEADLFVTVKLAGIRYTINGEISSAGTKVVMQEKLTILEAIANSGDIPLTGNKREVMLIRQLPQGTEIHTLDLTSIEIMSSPYYYIQPNDYIYIKPIKQKNWGIGTNGLQSFTTVVSMLSLLFTTYLLIKKN